MTSDALHRHQAVARRRLTALPGGHGDSRSHNLGRAGQRAHLRHGSGARDRVRRRVPQGQWSAELLPGRCRGGSGHHDQRPLARRRATQHQHPGHCRGVAGPDRSAVRHHRPGEGPAGARHRSAATSRTASQLTSNRTSGSPTPSRKTPTRLIVPPSAASRPSPPEIGPGQHRPDSEKRWGTRKSAPALAWLPAERARRCADPGRGAD